MDHGVVEAVVEVLETPCDAKSQVEARVGPRSETLRAVHERAERAHGAELEHEAKLVGALVPASAVELHEVRVVQWGHDLQTRDNQSTRREGGHFS
jgi:hypothetical protein